MKLERLGSGGSFDPSMGAIPKASAVGCGNLPSASSGRGNPLAESTRSSCQIDDRARRLTAKTEAIMAVLEDVKKITEKIAGRSRPSRDDLAQLVRPRKASRFRFKDDGFIPNHPRWPLLLYRGAMRFPHAPDPAAVFEEVFESNGWSGSWRDGIYSYVHYHSRIHEVLGIARGQGKVQFGGPRGRTMVLKAGDVAILPAGTGHQCLAASEDFLVVGAYPAFGTYDECTKGEDRARAVKSIPKVGRPRRDPIYGAEGPLLAIWTTAR